MPVFVDTNVFVYARDASERTKQPRAIAWLEHLWRARDGRVSIQVLQEYYATVTRTLSPGMSREDARADIVRLQAWRPITIDEAMLEDAWVAEDRWGLTFWDALVVSAARVAGCRLLLTEDLQDGMDLDGVLVVDPFGSEPGQLP